MNRFLKQFLPIIFCLNGIEGIFVLILSAAVPSDGKNSVLLGFSLPRLGIFIGVILISLFFLFAGWAVWKDIGWGRSLKERYYDGKKSRITLSFAFLMGFGLANVLLIPDYRWEYSIYLINRIRPVIVWGMLVFFQLSVPIFASYYQTGFSRIRRYGARQRATIALAISILGLFLGIWAWMGWSGMGIFPDSTFWNDPGVPLLAFQVYIAFVLGFVVFIFEQGSGEKTPSYNLKLDIGLCVLIFLTASILWNLTPQKSTVFAPGPYPPNNEFYPHSDAAVYNLSAQNALVGAGFNSPVGCPDKALYVTFLTWLNFFAGLNPAIVIILQVSIFALLPVIIFLIGHQLNNRSLGVIAALLAIFKESNAINSASIISTSMSKMLMSELPTAIFIALFILFLILWINHKGRIYYLAGVLGGLIGLASMVRLTTFIFVPLALLVFGFVLYKKWKPLVITSGIFLLVLFASILPWEHRVEVDCGASPFYYVLGPLEGVIWNNRYNPTPTPTTSPTPSPMPSATGMPQATQAAQSTPQPEQGSLIPTFTATATAAEYKSDQNKNINSPIVPVGKNNLDWAWKKLGGIGDKFKFISNHFFHNLLSTVLVLPTDLMHNDIGHIANQPNAFWSDNWDGRIDWLSAILLTFNLALIAMGCGLAWEKRKWAGIIPGLVFVVYCLALGVARTSGGRYIVPIDWILYLYYGLGLIAIMRWIHLAFKEGDGVQSDPQAANARTQTGRQQMARGGLVFVIFLGMGMMIPGTEKIFPAQVYQPAGLQIIKEDLRKGGYSAGDVEQSKLYVFSGRAISPRFFFYKQDIIPAGATGFPMRYQRFVFTLTGKNTPNINVVLPSRLIPDAFQNGTVVSVAGCFNPHGYMDAIMIIYGNRIYYRYPAAENLECPVKELVCDDDNRTCK